MNPKLIQAAQQRVQAADSPFDPAAAINSPKELLTGILTKVMGLQPFEFDVLSRVHVVVGVYEWDAMALDAGELRDAMVKAGFKLQKYSESFMSFDLDADGLSAFVMIAPDMGTVAVGLT